MLFMQSHHLKTKDKQSIKLNSFFGYERGGSRKMNSYELQQLYIKKREDKATARYYSGTRISSFEFNKLT